MRRAATQVAIATLVIAVAGYAAQLLGARILGPAAYASFAVFWAVVFLVVGFMNGIVQDATRTARLVKLRLDDGEPIDRRHRGHPRTLTVAILIGLGVSLLLGLSSPAWGPAVFGAGWLEPALLVAVAPVLVAAPLTFGGALAGHARWGAFSILIVLEALVRLALFILAAVLAPRAEWFMVATVVAFAASLPVPAFDRRTRVEVAALRSDAPMGRSLVRVLQAMLATGFSGVLVNGLPALISAAAVFNPRGATPADLGVLILLVILTRAPLTVPLSSFQSALIARFTGLEAAARRRWLLIGSALVLVASAVLAVIAALIGPPLLPLVFGQGFEAGPWLIGSLTFAASGLGIISLTSAAAIAASRHSLYLVGWAVAIAISLALLFCLPVSIDWATVIAVAVGPLAGAIVHVAFLRSRASTSAA